MAQAIYSNHAVNNRDSVMSGALIGGAMGGAALGGMLGHAKHQKNKLSALEERFNNATSASKAGSYGQDLNDYYQKAKGFPRENIRRGARKFNKMGRMGKAGAIAGAVGAGAVLGMGVDAMV